MIDFLTVPLGQDAPNVVNAVIEVAHDKATKFDKCSHVFRRLKPLNPPIHLPENYGFIPQARCADREPLGALILTDESSDPGCIRQVRPIGALEIAEDGVQLEKSSLALRRSSYFAKFRITRTLQRIYCWRSSAGDRAGPFGASGFHKKKLHRGTWVERSASGSGVYPGEPRAVRVALLSSARE